MELFPGTPGLIPNMRIVLVPDGPRLNDETSPAARDWLRMRTYLIMEAEATHYADSTPVNPRTQQIARELLSILECKELE